MISNDCSGTVNFPDQYTKSFKYDEEEYKIVWGNQQTGEVWNKGNNFSNLIFIQIKYVPYYRNHETNHEKKINQFWKHSSEFTFTRQNEKLKDNSSKKIYNTKYIDNRTMQRLHKWIVRLPDFMGERFTFSTLTFQPKQFSAVNLYGVQKMIDPSFQYNKKVIAQNTLYSLVSAIFLSFL